MPNKTIVFSVKNHIAEIILKKPVIDQNAVQELTEVCEQIKDNDDIYVVAITGSNDVFCQGREGDVAQVYRPAAAIAAIEQPVIAAINGDALGLGLEIALACDIRICVDKAHFAMPQVSKGCLPADGGTQRLTRIIGRGKALEMLLAAENITASEALEIGLVSKVVPAEALAGEVSKLAGAVATKGPIALRYLKEAVLKGMDMTLEQGLRLEADLYFLLHTTSDRTEGIKSFLAKRPPKYQGK